MSKGRVYLVGAGPGDPKLLTLRALEVLGIADTILHDRLVSDSILNLIPRDAKRVDVGKDRHHRGITQSEINRLMVEEAGCGKKVVRLKNGDPLLFARGGEELKFLKREGIDFEIVPGITSALAAPAYAGIPVTHRKYSSSVAILTGHEDPSKKETRIGWRELASRVDTLVILMGAGKLSEIAEELLAGGLSFDTPVAAIEWATTERQRVVSFTLEDAATGVVRNRVRPPSVVVVGRVASFAREFGWFGKKGVPSVEQESLIRRRGER